MGVDELVDGGGGEKAKKAIDEKLGGTTRGGDQLPDITAR